MQRGYGGERVDSWWGLVEWFYDDEPSEDLCAESLRRALDSRIFRLVWMPINPKR
ncbi:hypothetical protein T484DRAFT_1868932 [Baffinella frigidus]|nr:hypothetical protein T484DRAFT_1868932 [Cryptophyta sp. CCMP2293]